MTLAPHHHPRPPQTTPQQAHACTSRRPRLCRLRPCRQRACRSPHAAADALVVEHLPFAAKVAANYARRTGHPHADLEQLAAIGLIKASRRYDIHRPGRSPNHFIAYARPFVNGEITHYLRDKGFLITVPGRWRELHARGQKLLRQGIPADQLPERWVEITEACSVRVVAMPFGAQDEQTL